MLKLNDTVFDIERCYLDAYYDDGKLEVGLNIELNQNFFMGISYKPKIESEILFSIASGNPVNWKNMLCQTIEFDTVFDVDGDPRAILYLNEHLPLESCKVVIYKSDDSGLRISLQASVQCQLRGNELEKISVDLDSDLEFQCIWMGRELTVGWKTEIGCVVDLNDFKIVKDDNNVFKLELV